MRRKPRKRRRHPGKQEVDDVRTTEPRAAGPAGDPLLDTGYAERKAVHGYRDQEHERRQKCAAEACRPHGYDEAAKTIALAIASAQRWAKHVHGVQIGAGEALALIADHFVAVRKGGENVRQAGPPAPENE